MATEQQLAVAKEYFESNPGEGVVHISTDGQVFFQKNYNDAAGHQRRIDHAQKLVSIYRKELETIDVKSTSTSTLQADNFPTDKWKNKDIAEWLKSIYVETTGKETKAQLLELAKEAIASLQANEGVPGESDDDNSDENE